MKRTIIALALIAALAGVARAEVWNDPGGVNVTDTSQTVKFPRVFQDVLVLNDDAVDSIFVRLFWHGETPVAAVARTDFNTGSLEIKAGRNRSFSHHHGEKGSLSRPGYTAISLIGPAGGATVRIEGK